MLTPAQLHVRARSGARRTLAAIAVAAVAAAAAGTVAAAELELPRPSPFAKVSQDIGLTTVTVDYSCPGVKGRKIWGGVVPYDELWRTGANRATKITFSRDVTFAGKPVAAGTYALFTIPTKGDWTVVLNKRADQAGTGRDYKPEEDLLRVQLHPKAAPFRERMTFLFSDFTDDKASLDLEWEKLRLSIPIAADTGRQALASITAALDDSWRTYARAAQYMLESKKDYDTGLKYIDQSLALKEDWFNVWIKADLLAAKGRYDDAYPLAEKAYALGKKADVFFLEADVKKALDEWKKKRKS
jgi:tetratricopeptide (TPR) repeat protein